MMFEQELVDAEEGILRSALRFRRVRFRGLLHRQHDVAVCEVQLGVSFKDRLFVHLEITRYQWLSYTCRVKPHSQLDVIEEVGG